MATLAPRDEQELLDVVQAALANDTPLFVAGGRSRAGLGRPVNLDTHVTTSGLDGITMYEPSELVLTARAGTSLKTILDLVDQQGQELAFDPIDHGPLYGLPPDSGTVGGAISTNASGPRRFKAGAARDHVLGFRAVSGRGEVFQSGGRVMKNVTGYDLSKLMTGSFGTLGILTEITLKVLPKGETQGTLIVTGLEDAAAVAVLTFASGLPQEVSGLAHLPVTTEEGAVGLTGSTAAITALRVEGPEESVNQRLSDLRVALAARFGDRGCHSGAFEVLNETASRELWLVIRDAKSFAGPENQVWRISTAPTDGPKVFAGLLVEGVPVRRHYYDWAGGLMWLVVASAEDAHARPIRDVVRRHGGHATLMRADDAVRSSVPVFHPQPAALAALTERVKRSFDPELILNRGRMRSDI